MPATRKPRTMEDILMSGVAQLAHEAPRLLPNCSYERLHRLARTNRLRIFGKPQCVHIDHLMSQFEKGFPLLSEVDAVLAQYEDNAA